MAKPLARRFVGARVLGDRENDHLIGALEKWLSGCDRPGCFRFVLPRDGNNTGKSGPRLRRRDHRGTPG